jgi:hypothetical protein
MQEFLTERFKVFFGGCFAGGIASINWLFINTNIYIAFGFKLLGTIAITACSGLITLLVRDAYKHYKNKYKFLSKSSPSDEEKGGEDESKRA